MITKATCPSCGAPIVFALGSSIVVICEFCNSAIARTDRDVRDLGKVADIVDTRSPLAVGREGRLDGQSFVLTGRAQIAHSAGGVWDEWYASFGDGRTGWLAEAQGRFFLTFRANVQAPALATLRAGETTSIGSAAQTFTVSEVSSARPISAQGEIPYELVPDDEFYYADLSGPGGAFATIDYSEEVPVVFVGREVTLDEIGIRGSLDELDAPSRKVGAARLTCPKCGGPMIVRAPESERVTCPSCNALLDVDQGNLSYLRTLEARARPSISLGSVGTIDGVAYTVIGYMTRYCVVEAVTYQWEEYLLYEPRAGFRWLVADSGHWSFVTPISPGDVFDGSVVASYRGKQYKQFQSVNAYVETVLGEFYWRVEAGESVRARDFVNPPEILSVEGTQGEVNWSHGVYMASDEVAQVFKSHTLAPATNVGMAQPNPLDGAWRPWALLLGIAVLVGLVAQVTASRKVVYSQSLRFDPLATSDGTQVAFTDDFDLERLKNVRVKLGTPVDNTWAYVEGDIVNEQSGLVQTFSLPVEYYHGVDDGESWSEGSQSSDVMLSSLPSGTYTMRLEAQWERWQQPLSLEIEVQQGVPRLLYWLVLLGLLLVGLGVQAIRRRAFEIRRWSESMFNPYEE